MNFVGKRIKECRIANKLTQEDVANHLGIGKQAVYKYEIGAVTNIPLENIEKMASLFHTTPGYLACWDSAESVPDSVDSLQTDEHRLISSYRSLNPHGQELLLERAEELKLLHGKKPEDTVSQPG